MSTLKDSCGKGQRKRPGFDQGNLVITCNYVLWSAALGCAGRLAQKFHCEMSMSISTAQARRRCLAGFALFRSSEAAAPKLQFRSCSFPGAQPSVSVMNHVSFFRSELYFFPEHFEVWTFPLLDRCQVSDTFFVPVQDIRPFGAELQRWQAWEKISFHDGTIFYQKMWWRSCWHHPKGSWHDVANFL